MAKRPPEPSLFDDNDSTNGSGGPPPPAAPRGGGAPPPGEGPTIVSLHEAAQSRYLNYALSVITSRALPDVRDGLKPVQRRILYTMWQQNLTADAKHRKCAKVVGDVMGNYHPHGDSAIYETLVRIAQSFSLRYPLVDGSGNFGSLDGDAAAAMRYTECRLARVSDEILQEIEQATVPFRPNYDGTRQEPVVLPSRIPNLLINGATGIAVGMATNIPPHNLHEVSTALVKLLDDPDLTSVQLCRWVKGPDFPTGGHILNSPDELKEIYRTGSGSVRIRATWEAGPTSRSAKLLYVTSVPYGVNKAQLVEQIGDVVLGRKMPHLVDVRDLSTDDVRIELELKAGADEHLVMAYLFKHTSLQTTFAVNMTCLVPTENAEVGRPERLDLKQMLWHFLHFRLDVVTARLEHELAQLEKRIHILEGFEKIFDALDEIIRIIRKSDGKADAADKIIARFSLDAEQTDAILELKLYRLARLEILVIQKELADKRARARQIAAQLADEGSRWTLVRDEIVAVQKKYGDPKTDPRRTRIEVAEEIEYSADAFIVDEDNIVIVSRDGWVKRQKEVKDLATTRLREGDGVLAALAGSTRATAVFFTNFGAAYTVRFIDVPATTGYGEPVQKLFKFKDGERVIAAFSLDARVRGDIGYVPDAETVRSAGTAARSAGTAVPASPDDTAEAPPVHALAVTSDGYSLRFSFAGFVEPSTRSGRRYARLPEGAEVVAVERTTGDETVIAATRGARAMLCAAEEINFLSGPGRGVILIKVQDDDRVIGAMVSKGDRDLMTVETSRGAEQTISTAKYEVTGRGGKGRELMQRAQFVRVLPGDVSLPVLPAGE
jgi:DNA gyrase subunit A